MVGIQSKKKWILIPALGAILLTTSIHGIDTAIAQSCQGLGKATCDVRTDCFWIGEPLNACANVGGNCQGLPQGTCNITTGCGWIDGVGCTLIPPQPSPPPPGGGTNPCDEDGIFNPLCASSTIGELLLRVGGFLFTVAIAVSTIMLLVGAYQLLTATGRPDRIDRGKKTLIWAVIGFVVAAVAGSIPTLITLLLSS